MVSPERRPKLDINSSGNQELASRGPKKSDLYSSIWASCDQLRGGMDASQYKDYVLFMLFIKYVSDKYAELRRLRAADRHS